MNIAVLKNNVVIDVATFEDDDGYEQAQSFLSDDMWPDADSVVELEDGFGIGDTFDGETWTINPDRVIQDCCDEPYYPNPPADENNVLPAVATLFEFQAMQAGGDASIMRAMASSVPVAFPSIPVRDWFVGMTTRPGDMVYDRDREFAYLFSGATAMTHHDPGHFPGAPGVHHWSIIPRLYRGYRVWPGIEGIIVSVRQGEIWWNPELTRRFRWVGVDNHAAHWSPTADLPAIWEEEE